MNRETKIKFNKINVGMLGLIPVDIPIVTIGEGEPKAVIICGMHGDEKSSLFIVEKLIDILRHKKVKGEVKIVLAANSWSQALNTRVFPNDNMDLNRVFPGDGGGDLSKRLAKSLFELCKGSKVVIDLHTFEGICPIVGLFMNSGSKKVKTESLKIMKIFDPDAVWKLNFTLPDEVRLSGALGPILANEGIPNFAVETMGHISISQKQLDKVTKGLLSVLASLGMVSGSKPGSTRSLLMFERMNVRASKTGLFTSNKKVMTDVKKGEKIGELVLLPDFVREEVMATCSGTLIINKDRDLVSTGDQLFSIGLKTSALS